MTAIILKGEDWEGLFIDGKLVDEGHSLGEGNGKFHFLKQATVKYGFSIQELEEKEVTEEDGKYLYTFGSFPNNINDLHGSYENSK